MKRRDFVSGSIAGIAGAVALNNVKDRTLPIFHRLYNALGTAPAFGMDGDRANDIESAIAKTALAYYRMVCNAEGTYDDALQTSEDLIEKFVPYRVLVGHAIDPSVGSSRLVPLDREPWKNHPGVRTDISFPGYPVPLPRNQVSDAAGATQFISTTYETVMNLSPGDFQGDVWSPENQDRAFFMNHSRTNAHTFIRKSVTLASDGWVHISYADWARAINNDSREWASLPGANIGAATGQSTKSLMFLWSRFQWELSRQFGLHRHVLFPVQGMTHDTAAYTSHASDRRLHPVTGEPRPHRGIDIGIPEGTPIVATEDCQIKDTFWDNGGAGNVLTYVPTQEQTATIRLFHLKEFKAQPGDIVRKGDVIALSGNTGASTGPHLHFEYWPHGYWTDPRFYLSQGVIYG